MSNDSGRLTVLTNDMLHLAEEKLEIYSVWSGVIRAALDREGAPPPGFGITFTFTAAGTSIVAHCTAYTDDSKDLVIRSCGINLTA